MRDVFIKAGESCQKSVYVAHGVNFAGKKEVLGLWIAEHEGAGFRAAGRAGRHLDRPGSGVLYLMRQVSGR
jgi:hypothetical protein